MSLVTAERESKRKPPKKPTAFEILNEHARRAFRDIEKGELINPVNDYQRDESTGKIAAEIALHFDKVAFHCLLVIERANGDLVVADGGTRLSAVLQRDDIDKVPCLVFSGLTDKQEGDVFLAVNCNRQRLRTEQQHHAELWSDHDLAIRTQQLLDQLHRARVGFDSLSSMRSSVKANYPATQTVVNICIVAATDRHITSRVMKALIRLETMLRKEDKTLNKPAIIKRMQHQFGSFDAVVNAVIKPRQTGSTLDMARALARTMKIKLPRE